MKSLKRPEKVFVVHGEETTAVGFADHLVRDLQLSAYVPYSGDAFDLLTGKQVGEGSRQKVEKKAAGRQGSSVFDRLVIAGERLMVVIRKCQGMANKDLAKFADQINALCDKWER